jgi:hypothetical protein
MGKTFRLLPAPVKTGESQAAVPQREIVVRKRKQPVPSACEECRKRKSKVHLSLLKRELG